MEIIIDLKKVNNEQDFYEQLMKQDYDFGVYFGRNIDAFIDYIGLLGGKKIIFIDYDLFLLNVKSTNFIKEIIEEISKQNIKVINHNLDSSYFINLIIQ